MYPQRVKSLLLWSVGFGVWGLGLGFGFGVWGLGFRVRAQVEARNQKESVGRGSQDPPGLRLPPAVNFSIVNFRNVNFSPTPSTFAEARPPSARPTQRITKGFHIETHIIYELNSRKFTTHNDLY